MAESKVTALNPTVRRALGSPLPVPAPPVSAESAPDTAERCARCHDLGIVPGAGGSTPVFRSCPACRTEALGLFVTRIAPNRWIAVRDIPGLWGAGGCAVDAYLDLERRTPESASAFGHRYVLPAMDMADGRQQRRGRVA